MHYYTFKPKDYMSKTAFLEPMEDLAYRRMLDHCYLTEQPLPADVSEIAMLIRMRTHTDSIKVVLHYFFELTPQGYVNDRIARELLAYHGKSEKAKASAEARWAKERNKIKDVANDANALRNECEGNTNHKPITNNQEPITSNQYIYTFDLNYVNTNLQKAGKRTVDQKYIDELQPQFELYYADQCMTDNKALVKFVQWIMRNQDQSQKQPTITQKTAHTLAEQRAAMDQQRGSIIDVGEPKKLPVIEEVGRA